MHAHYLSLFVVGVFILKNAFAYCVLSAIYADDAIGIVSATTASTIAVNVYVK